MYDSDSEGAASSVTNQTYVKPIRTEKSLPRNTHPPYIQMVHESIASISTHGKAVSRAKIVDHVKGKYGLNDVSNTHMSRALKLAQEKKMIENTTASGAAGSFKLTKTFKEQQKSAAKTLIKKDSKTKLQTTTTNKEEKETKKKSKDDVFDDESNNEVSVSSKKSKSSVAPKKTTTTKKKTTTAKNDDKENDIAASESEEFDEAPVKPKKATATKRPSAKSSKSSEGDDVTVKKKASKKPPTGKENKSKDTSSGEKKILKEKIKSLKKATSTPALKEVDENMDEEEEEVRIEKPKRGRKAK